MSAHRTPARLIPIGQCALWQESFHRSDLTSGQIIQIHLPFPIGADSEMISYKVKIRTPRNKRSVAAEGLAFVHKHNNEHDFHTANTVSTRKNGGAKWRRRPQRHCENVPGGVIEKIRLRQHYYRKPSWGKTEGKSLWCNNLASPIDIWAKFSTRKKKKNLITNHCKSIQSIVFAKGSAASGSGK